MHISVLKNEVIQYLAPKPNDNFIDATVGFAGHSKSILEQIKPNGRVLGFELDPDIFKEVDKQKIDRLDLINQCYTNLKRVVEEKKFRPVSGIIFDLGMSSWHIDNSGKGFSFLKDEPLDMRFSGCGAKASEIINSWPPDAIEDILKKYGDERYAREIAKAIVKHRQKHHILTTQHLVGAIKGVFPDRIQSRKINPATKTFQALRIAVNDELEKIKQTLPQILEVLDKGARIVIISFHSGEDRLIKHYFKDKAKSGELEIITKKPIQASRQEVLTNPRSRSAKLRAAVIK